MELFGIRQAASLLNVDVARLRYLLCRTEIEDVKIKVGNGWRVFSLEDIRRIRQAIRERDAALQR